MSLSTARTVTDISDRIDWFSSTATSDEESRADQVCTTSVTCFHEIDDLRTLGETTYADILTGEPSDIRIHHEDTSLTKYLDIADSCWVLPHLRMHGWDQHHGCFRANHDGSEKVIGPTTSNARDQIRSRWGYDDQIGFLPDLYMRNLCYVTPEFGDDRSMR
jgi:hypothetical protein